MELIWSFKIELKIFFLIISLFFLYLISGCENVDVINPQVDYQEYIVVRAELRAYNPFEGVSFTKTLPLDMNYDIKKAELKDVIAYLKIDGIKNYYFALC